MPGSGSRAGSRTPRSPIPMEIEDVPEVEREITKVRSRQHSRSESSKDINNNFKRDQSIVVNELKEDNKQSPTSSSKSLSDSARSVSINGENKIVTDRQQQTGPDVLEIPVDGNSILGQVALSRK